MDLSRIKQLVKSNGDKFVMIENGEPELVVMSFDEYQKLLKNDSDDLNLHSDGLDESGYWNRHQESSIQTAGWESEPAQETEFEVQQVSEPAGLPMRLEDIKLEDLPI